jgi:hypothetical protein
MQRADFRYSEEIKDSVFVILPNERKLIKISSAGAMLKHDHPSEIMNFEKLQFEVFINNIKLEKNLCERQYWEYTTKPLEGTYLLVINEQTISEASSNTPPPVSHDPSLFRRCYGCKSCLSPVTTKKNQMYRCL